MTPIGGENKIKSFIKYSQGEIKAWFSSVGLCPHLDLDTEIAYYLLFSLVTLR